MFVGFKEGESPGPTGGDMSESRGNLVSPVSIPINASIVPHDEKCTLCRTFKLHNALIYIL